MTFAVTMPTRSYPSRDFSARGLSSSAAKLTHEEHIVVEATGNARAMAEAVATFVGRIASGSSSPRKPGAAGAGQCLILCRRS
jgi:hypothetical protein